MSILELFQGAAAITVILSAIYAYWKLKHIQKMVIPIADDVKAYVEAWLNSETGQKALFMVGGIIAQGAKSGFGIQKSGGKRGIEGMVMELVGSFIQSKIGVGIGLPAGQPQQPQGSNNEALT
jgi:hypothetical protein